MTENIESCSFPHMASLDKPLTLFLIALCHSAELRTLFNSDQDRDGVLRDWGLAEHALFQPEAHPPTLAEVQAAVAEEFGSGSGIEVAWWISVPHWVWGFEAEEPE